MSVFLPLYEEISVVHHKFTISPLPIVQGAMLYLLNGIELNGIELNGIELNGIEETHHGGVVARGICRAGHSQHLGGAASCLC